MLVSCALSRSVSAGPVFGVNVVADGAGVAVAAADARVNAVVNVTIEPSSSTDATVYVPLKSAPAPAITTWRPAAGFENVPSAAVTVALPETVSNSIGVVAAESGGSVVGVNVVAAGAAVAVAPADGFVNAVVNVTVEPVPLTEATV